ncbi:MAG TPA: TrkA family potassium uptake protein [Phototrophicaceae bacterium]|jgi:Trk K+ transport system NAD-binding subunit|nr:TrkA family potassium uptake protein [Phototrophicaceae bacterium]
MPGGKRRSSRIIRFLRAVQRDSSALLNEFRNPLMVLVLTLVGGGFLYRELMGIAGQPQPPLYDMPYIMLALMVLQPPFAIPTEPYLIIFWYLMPFIAVYVVGRGASEFIQLFFNRSERRDAWEEAVASTYRNHIIVMGVGHVGMRVTRTLVQMGFEVVVIDQELSPELDVELSELNAPAIVGDARQTLTLDKAGLPFADAFIACTSNDLTNLEAIMAVRELNPDVRIVARMWDDRYSRHLRQFMGVDAVLSSSDLSAPVFAGSAVGIEITQTLMVHGKEYSMIRLTVEAGSFMDGNTVKELQDKYKIDIVLHGQDGEVEVHPEGLIRIQAGDILVVFASHEQITDLVARNRRARRSRS